MKLVVTTYGNAQYVQYAVVLATSCICKLVISEFQADVAEISIQKEIAFTSCFKIQQSHIITKAYVAELIWSQTMYLMLNVRLNFL